MLCGNLYVYFDWKGKTEISGNKRFKNDIFNISCTQMFSGKLLRNIYELN